MKELFGILTLVLLSASMGYFMQTQNTAAEEKTKAKASYRIHMKRGYIEMYNQRDILIWSGMFDENCNNLETAILDNNL